MKTLALSDQISFLSPMSPAEGGGPATAAEAHLPPEGEEAFATILAESPPLSAALPEPTPEPFATPQSAAQGFLSFEIAPGAQDLARPVVEATVAANMHFSLAAAPETATGSGDSVPPRPEPILAAETARPPDGPALPPRDVRFPVAESASVDQLTPPADRLPKDTAAEAQTGDAPLEATDPADKTAPATQRAGTETPAVQPLAPFGMTPAAAFAPPGAADAGAKVAQTEAVATSPRAADSETAFLRAEPQQLAALGVTEKSPSRPALGAETAETGTKPSSPLPATKAPEDPARSPIAPLAATAGGMAPAQLPPAESATSVSATSVSATSVPASAVSAPAASSAAAVTGAAADRGATGAGTAQTPGPEPLQSAEAARIAFAPPPPAANSGLVESPAPSAAVARTTSTPATPLATPVQVSVLPVRQPANESPAGAVPAAQGSLAESRIRAALAAEPVETDADSAEPAPTTTPTASTTPAPDKAATAAPVTAPLTAPLTAPVAAPVTAPPQPGAAPVAAAQATGTAAVVTMPPAGTAPGTSPETEAPARAARWREGPEAMTVRDRADPGPQATVTDTAVKTAEAVPTPASGTLESPAPATTGGPLSFTATGGPERPAHLPGGGEAAAGATRAASPHAIAHQMSQALADAGNRTVELTLSPEELGKVRMTLNSSDGSITVTVQAERPETLDLMRRNIDSLARDFRDMGYANIDFDFGQQTDRRPSAQEQAAAESARQPAPTERDSIARFDTASLALQSSPRTASGGLDLRI
ncbi:flagellar hook-length control protein FliK [Rhodobacter capsulatus]|uniref:flagellar hook-length control protein FliK n=1 Tax=Rhodobacter capsulatus TaxID=1061 RepID=UPI0040263724